MITPDKSKQDNKTYYDYLFGVIGRMLLVAQRYESNIKALAMLLHLKTDFITEEDILNRIVEKISSKNTLYQNINSIINRVYPDRLRNLYEEEDIEDYYDWRGHFSTMFNEAREARNYIAHEITLNFDQYDAVNIDVDTFTRLIDDYKSVVTKILYADICVISSIASLQDEASRPGHKYIDNTIGWIFMTDN